MVRTRASTPAASQRDQEFNAWKEAVSRLCLQKFELRLSDLPDMMTRDAFDSGVSPEDFFADDVMNVMREDFGDLVDEL